MKRRAMGHTSTLCNMKPKSEGFTEISAKAVPGAISDAIFGVRADVTGNVYPRFSQNERFSVFAGATKTQHGGSLRPSPIPP